MSGDEAGDTIATDGAPASASPTAEPEQQQPAAEVKPGAEGAPRIHAAERDSDGGDSQGYDADRRRSRRRTDGAGDAVLCRPLEVVVRDDKVDQAIRQLKNRLAREGILRELKNRRHYFKPSELKRIKRREAARRRRKQARQRARK